MSNCAQAFLASSRLLARSQVASRYTSDRRPREPAARSGRRGRTRSLHAAGGYPRRARSLDGPSRRSAHRPATSARHRDESGTAPPALESGGRIDDALRVGVCHRCRDMPHDSERPGRRSALPPRPLPLCERTLARGARLHHGSASWRQGRACVCTATGPVF